MADAEIRIADITNSTCVRHVEYHEQLASTNLLAAELIDDLAAVSPALVWTTQQTSGRGRGGHQWWASTGALTFSFVKTVADFGLTPESTPLISLAAGLAVRRFVAERIAGRNVTVKWPNDVYVGEQKVSGILTELKPTNSGKPAAIVGIGINLNNSLGGAPAELRSSATSCFDLTGDSEDLMSALVDVLVKLEAAFAELGTDHASTLAELNACNFLEGRRIEVSTEATSIAGTVRSIGADGTLQLQTATGIESINAGTVTLRGSAP